MDGLSAASSVFAVFSLALDLPTAVQNFLEFCRLVKDAPDDIKALIREVETLAVAVTYIRCSNEVKELDGIINSAVHECNNELSKLREALGGLVLDLNSPSRRKRGIGSLRSAFNRPHIEAMRASLEKVKSTLLLACITSSHTSILELKSLVEIQFQSQQQFHLDTMRMIEGNPRGLVGNKTETRFVAKGLRLPSQLGRQSSNQLFLPPPDDINPYDELQYGLSNEESTFKGNVQTGTSSAAVCPHPSSTTSGEIWLGHWGSTKYTPLGVLQQGHRKKIVMEDNKFISSKVLEYRRTWKIYPSSLLSFLGIRYGAMIECDTSDWQYVITPFNAVPENAQIFKFCREGDLDRVRALLTLGQASLKDRDPMGRTPLWVAAQSLQLQVAEFLVREGADIHAEDWAQSSPRPPLLALQDNSSIDAEKRGSFISLFEHYHPGSHDKDTIWSLMGKLIMFYRPGKALDMTLQYRQDSTLALARQVFQYYLADEPNSCSEIALCMLSFGVQEAPLQWALRNVKGTILEWDERQQPHASHHVFTKRLIFTDWISAKLIVEKSRNLHARWYPNWTVSGLYQNFTPTTLALYRPAAFDAWRHLLREYGHDFTDFVERELLDSPLVDDGWTVSTLLWLFNSAIPAGLDSSPAIALPCDRCDTLNHAGTISGYNPMHLPWRRYLHSVRNGRTDPFDNTIQAPFSLVCSLECADKFCVAGMYENDLRDEDLLFGPDVPRYEDPKLAMVGKPELLGDDCPSKKMPGAYVE